VAADRASPARRRQVAGLPATVPVPTGAKVVANMAMNVDGKQTEIFFDPVTPAKVASFYTAALPRDGYKITGSNPGIPGLGRKNVTTVTVTR
jgi:hypothetical protein